MFLDAAMKLTERQLSLAVWLIEYIESRVAKGEGPPTEDQLLNDLCEDFITAQDIIADALIGVKANAQNEHSH